MIEQNNGKKIRAGVLGNNRSTAAISNQIGIMMRAAIESIARQRGEDVDRHENDMDTHVHKETDERQARKAQKFSTLNTLRLTRPEGRSHDA